MNKNEIKQAISGIAQLLGNNPELMQQQLTALKAFVPDLDETAIQGIVEKTKATNFRPSQLEEELQRVVGAINSASQNQTE
jgi:hypothetical protein